MNFPSDLTSLSQLSEKMKPLCFKAGFNEEQTNLIDVCVVEAVTNCILHAYKKEKGHTVQVETNQTPTQFIIEISDQGTPMDEARLQSAAVEEDPTNIEALSDGGRGLFMMKEVMDEVNYTSKNGKNTLKFVKNRPIT